jgi:septum site-determining protein MinC
MDLSTVVVKGDKRGVCVYINERAEFDDAFNELVDKLSARKDFFAGSRIQIAMGARRLTEEQEKQFAELANELELDSQFVSRRLSDLRIPRQPTKTSGTQKKPDLYAANTLLIKRTIRSGQLVDYPHSVVVLGDVNAGAEVRSAGDIVVFGHLRGIAHAGKQGNMGAVVIALRLQPTQLRIGSCISRAPDEVDDTDRGPEMAFVKDSRIVIKPFNSGKPFSGLTVG